MNAGERAWAGGRRHRARHAPAPMRLLCIKGFAPMGGVEFLSSRFRLTGDGSVAAALELKER